ncbi:hypothetical protein MHYP_G00091480 [Metynnis hypsauchen]
MNSFDVLGIPFSFTFELRDKGKFSFKLPEDQIQPTCEEAYQGAMSIITHVHDKTFTSAAFTVRAMLWTTLTTEWLSSTTLLSNGRCSGRLVQWKVMREGCLVAAQVTGLRIKAKLSETKAHRPDAGLERFSEVLTGLDYNAEVTVNRVGAFGSANPGQISAWMEQMEKDHPDVVSSMTYGTTYEKRNITLLKIGLNSTLPKKAIWMDCGIHAREWIAPAFCQYFVKEILGLYKTDPKMNELFKNLDFYITPVLNMDGYIYSWIDNTTRLWRKSRSPGTDGCTCFGTDLNRNFYANWGMVGISRNCCSEVYNGQSPLSESEAVAVTDFLSANRDQLLCFLTIHSYGQLILVPYGHPNISAPNYDELMEVGLAAAKAIKAVHGMDYTVGTSPDVLYANSGSSRDFARLIGIPFSFTFELRDKGDFGFKLPEDQIQPTCEEAYQGAMSIITYAHDKTFTSAAFTVTATLWTTLTAAWLSSTTLL